MKMSILVHSIGVCLATWISWRILKYLVARDPLANIPGPRADSWIGGNIARLMASDGWEYHQTLTRKYGKVFSIAGFMSERNLYVYDPKALQHIFIKDQHIYEEASDLILTNLRVFGPGLVSTLGNQHKKQRKMVNPVFGVAHMRGMTPTFYSVARRLVNGMSQQISRGEDDVIDVLSWMTRTSLEIIGRSGLGFSFDSLEPDSKQHPFAISMKNLLRSLNAPLIALFRFTLFKTTFHWGTPRLQRAVMDALPWSALHEVRDMVDVMHETAKEVLEASRRAVAGGDDGAGRDVMSILLKANMAAGVEDRLPDDELLAQISTITFGAMDTTSNAISRALDLLSTNPDAQGRLREEVLQAHEEHGEELDYDALMGLPYLDGVCKETLRLHPPAPFLGREVAQDVLMPLSQPMSSTDGRTLSSIFVPKGTRILTSLVHCNCDPDIWGPDAWEWKPERWMGALPETVVGARVPGVYSNMMTFIGGNRACIGVTFAVLEMKVVLSLLVKSFGFTHAPGRKIIWQLNGVIQPTTEDAPLTAGGEKKLQLPLQVSLSVN